MPDAWGFLSLRFEIFFQEETDLVHSSYQEPYRKHLWDSWDLKVFSLLTDLRQYSKRQLRVLGFSSIRRDCHSSRQRVVCELTEISHGMHKE